MVTCTLIVSPASGTFTAHEIWLEPPQGVEGVLEAGSVAAVNAPRSLKSTLSGLVSFTQAEGATLGAHVDRTVCTCEMTPLFGATRLPVSCKLAPDVEEPTFKV